MYEVIQIIPVCYNLPETCCKLSFCVWIDAQYYQGWIILKKSYPYIAIQQYQYEAVTIVVTTEIIKTVACMQVTHNEKETQSIRSRAGCRAAIGRAVYAADQWEAVALQRQPVTVRHCIWGPPASPRHHCLPRNSHHSADLLAIANTHARTHTHTQMCSENKSHKYQVLKTQHLYSATSCICCRICSVCHRYGQRSA